MQPGTSGNPLDRRGAARASRLLLGVACLLAGLCAGVLWLPLQWFQRELAMPLDAARMWPESGLAFVAECAASVPSDRDGHSPLRLTEDGRELSPHAVHDQIRSHGGGLFSHWGNQVYFSTTDGSDPRANGRAYAMVVPAPAPRAAWALPGLGVAALAGVLGAQLGARGRGAAGRWTVAAGLLLLAAGALAAGSGAATWQHELAAVEERFSAPAAGPPSELPPVQSAGTARTLPLLDAATFVCAGTAKGPSAPPPIGIALAPAAGLLARNAAPIALSVDGVGEVVLRLRVLKGERLLVRFLTEHGNPDGSIDRSSVELEVPVRAGADWQSVALRQPLLLQRPQEEESCKTRLVGLELADPVPGLGLAPHVELGEALVSGALAPFRHETHGRGRVEVGESLRPANWQCRSGEWTCTWPAGAGRRIKGAIAVLAERGDSPANWTVSVDDERGGSQGVCAGSAAPSSGWVEFAADLPADTRPARLRLRCADLPAGSVAAWSSVRVIDTSRPPRRVLLTLVDTLRADAVSCLGGPAGQTPELDALAAQGALFESCFAQAHWTRPSIPSIMAGRYVTATGVQLISQRLPASCDTLAEHFLASGFHTVAFLTNSNAGPSAGLDRGFEETRMFLDRPLSQDTGWYLARHVTPRLVELQDEDLFVYLHLMQVHAPYGPPARPADWPEAERPGQLVPFDRHLDPAWIEAPTAEGRIARYRWDVRQLDAAFGSFVREWLGRWEGGAGAPAIVAVMADHGEYLGEHGHWEHGWHRLEPEVLHVPLLIRAPGLAPAGLRCDTVVQNMDVGATLLDLAGAERPLQEPGRGRSLRPLLAQGTLPQPFALASGEVNGTRLFTLVTAQGGLVGVDGELVRTLESGGGRDLEQDPPATLWQEQCSLAPAFARSWDLYLASQRAAYAQLGAGGEDDAPAFDPRALQELQFLGYMGR